MYKEDKQRFVIVIEKNLLDKVKALAAKENRSTSNMAVTIIRKYFEENQN